MIISAEQAKQRLEEQMEKEELKNMQDAELYIQKAIDEAIKNKLGFCYIAEENIELALKTNKEVEAYLKQLGYITFYEKDARRYKIVWDNKEMEKEKNKRSTYNTIKTFLKTVGNHEIDSGRTAIPLLLLIVISGLISIFYMSEEKDLIVFFVMWIFVIETIFETSDIMLKINVNSLCIGLMTKVIEVGLILLTLRFIESTGFQTICILWFSFFTFQILKKLWIER